MNDPRGSGAAAALLAMRQEGRGGRGSGKAETAGHPEKSALAEEAGPRARDLRFPAPWLVGFQLTHLLPARLRREDHCNIQAVSGRRDVRSTSEERRRDLFRC